MLDAAARAEWRRGWPLVGGVAIGVSTGYALYGYVSSLFVPALEAAFGWTRGDIATAASASFAGAVAAPLVGRLTDRHGVRPVLLVSLAGLGAVYLAMAFQPGDLGSYFALSLAFAVIGMGTSGITFTRAIASWFDRSRGLAMAVALSGISVAAVLLPPALQAAMAAWGWQAGYQILAGLALLVGLPVCWRLVSVRDESPDSVRSMPGRVRITAHLAMRRFWALIMFTVCINIPGIGLLGQLAPLMADKGLSADAAALMLSTYAGAVFLGRLTGGYLLDRLWAPGVASAMMIVPAIGCLLLIGGPLTVGVAAAGAAALGFQQGAELDIIPVLIARYFGLEGYATLYGVATFAIVGSGAVGAIAIGRLYDATGGYDIALGGGAVLFLAGGASVLAMGRYPPPTAASGRQDG